MRALRMWPGRYRSGVSAKRLLRFQLSGMAGTLSGSYCFNPARRCRVNTAPAAIQNDFVRNIGARSRPGSGVSMSDSCTVSSGNGSRSFRRHWGRTIRLIPIIMSQQNSMNVPQESSGGSHAPHGTDSPSGSSRM